MSRLIKPFDDNKHIHSAQAFNMSDLQAQMENLVQSARRQAALILKDAGVQAAEIKRATLADMEKKSYEEGFAKGLKAGREQAYEQTRKELSERAAPLVKSLESVLQAVESERRTIQKKASVDLLGLAFQIAEIIVKAQVEADLGVLRRNVEAAIDLTLEKSRLEISVNPEDMGLMEEFVEEIKENFDNVEEVVLVGDTGIERGGCRVSTPSGDVDAALQTQFEEIRRQLSPGHG